MKSIKEHASQAIFTRPQRKSGLCVGLLLGAAFSASIAHADVDNLPTLGDATSATISLQQEYELGHNWARILRRQVKLLSDPIVTEYMNDLVWKLVPYSELQDRRLEVIPIDTPQFNAFAAPGGIIGINGGPFLFAQTEDEIASVLAHELGHLSQRHYAQQLAEQKRNQPLMLAGLLASILVGVADSQAGSAGVTSTLAASASSQLAFSRRNEREADRVGMDTLSSAGYDPYAMPQMFGELQKKYRYSGAQLPEFLLTHPVTESRIADSLNRASYLKRPGMHPPKIEFEIVKQRLTAYYARDKSARATQALSDAKKHNASANIYGAIAAYAINGQVEKIDSLMKQLPQSWQRHPYVRITYIEALANANKLKEAYEEARKLNSLYPDSRPVEDTFAQMAQQAGNIKAAVSTLRMLTSRYPNDASYWTRLAEAEGLSGNQVAVYDARAEYLLLTGQFDEAYQQVQYALKDPHLNSVEKTRLEQKGRDIRTQQKEMKKAM